MGRLLDDLHRLSAATAQGNVLIDHKAPAGPRRILAYPSKAVASGGAPQAGFRGRAEGVMRKVDLITRHESADFVAQHYQVVRDIGRGSFSRVQLVRDRRSNHERVCKIVRTDEMAPEVLQLTRAEIEVLAELDHPSIVKLYEYADDIARKRLVLILEYVAGGDCSGLLDGIQGSALSEARIARLTRQLLMATNCCHSRGIVHRDIKPQNMMLTSGIGAWEAPDLKLIDFGLAAKMERSRDLVGTPAYMPPEVLEGLVDYTSQADLWSIGCTVVELLSGETPFGRPEDNGGDMEPVFDAIRAYRAFDDVADRLEESSAWSARSDLAKDFVRRLLVRDPEHRMTAEQALSHPWMSKGTPAWGGITADMVRSMAQYAAAPALLRHCLFVVAVRTGAVEGARLSAAFASADADGNGSLSREELVDAVARIAICGWSFVGVDADSVFDAADLDRNGRLGYTEFAAACLYCKYSRCLDRLADLSFSSLDEGRRGSATLDGVRPLFSERALRDVAAFPAGRRFGLREWRACIRASCEIASERRSGSEASTLPMYDGDSDECDDTSVVMRLLRMFACEQLLCSGCEQFHAGENDDETACFGDAPPVLCHDFDPASEAPLSDYKVPDLPLRIDSPFCVEVVRGSRRDGSARKV